MSSGASQASAFLRVAMRRRPWPRGAPIAVARRVLLDTGVLVAMLNTEDSDHLRVVECLRDFRARFVTVEGVLIECAHITRKIPNASLHVIDAVLRLHCEIHATTHERLTKARALLQNGRGRLDLVDALLVVAAHELRVKEVLTLDQRDFSRLRAHDGARLRLFPQL